ncbi:hypothetical protein [Actinoplanes couchii]|uniref:Uncharacterized protein n=1 Tax=Actinoplanes couchii TaxID=403638 RepID=A0ABQ3XCQ5_9ACTN|nr:hypothetical protein [Actinoplanes couchii]MDR6321160.1 hypothetical protein [Actinoplanes couchii]GID56269.1 hypothetical protein Aco03nite_046730 [Actinoplanes couchii]
MTDGTPVPYSCAHCSGPAFATQSIAGRRLHWDVHHPCPAGPVLECGRDETPADVRRALLADEGTHRLQLSGGTNRLAAMRVLRTWGIPLNGLTADVTGTATEMRLLALLMADAGVTASVQGQGAGSGPADADGP